MTGMIIIQAIYLGWIFCIKANTDKWVYNVLNVLSWPERIGFFAFSLSIPLTLYFLGEFINNLVWGSKTKEETASTKKKAKAKKN
jgi:hypothetical protein